MPLPALALAGPALRFMKNPWLIGAVVVAGLMTGAYFKGRLDVARSTEAAILDSVIDGAIQVIEAQKVSRERAERIAQLLRERQEIAQALEQALLKEIPVYVTPEMDQLCRMPGRYGRLLNEARKGRPVLPEDAGAADGRAGNAP